MITEIYSHPLYFLSKLGILTQISALNLDLSTKSNSKSLKDWILSSKGERIWKKALNSLTKAYSEYGIYPYSSLCFLSFSIIKSVWACNFWFCWAKIFSAVISIAFIQVFMKNKQYFGESVYFLLRKSREKAVRIELFLIA